MSDEALLHAVMDVLEPLAGLMMSRQLRHADAEELLKAAFVKAGTQAFIEQGKLPTTSNLSVATGIRRREVKRLQDEPALSTPRKVSLASQARLRWVTDPAYLDAHGQPRRLPRHAQDGQPSFASLAATLSKDTHSRTLLDEMVRCALVQEDGDQVVLLHRFDEPQPKQDSALHAAGANVGDHLAAVVKNLSMSPPPLLERAVFADGLTEASAKRAADLSRDVWAKALAELREKLQALVNLDADVADNHWRVRIGLYSFFGPDDETLAASLKAQTMPSTTNIPDQTIELAVKRPRGRPRKNA